MQGIPVTTAHGVGQTGGTGPPIAGGQGGGQGNGLAPLKRGGHGVGVGGQGGVTPHGAGVGRGVMKHTATGPGQQVDVAPGPMSKQGVAVGVQSAVAAQGVGVRGVMGTPKKTQPASSITPNDATRVVRKPGAFTTPHLAGPPSRPREGTERRASQYTNRHRGRQPGGHERNGCRCLTN